MRDIFVSAIIFGSLPFILWRPHIGVLVWTWISFMNPHRLTWGFAYDMNFALIVALTTMVSMAISREPKKIPVTGETVVLFIFILWMLLTTVFSIFPWFAWNHYGKVVKIMLMVYVTMMLMQSKERINALVWILAMSLAFYGVKGGIFTILNGGVYHVRGPEGSFIGGDNELGLALSMTIPLLRYMQLTTRRGWLRVGIAVAMVLTALAAIGSQSRGAMLGLCAMGGFLWLKSRSKIFTGVLGICAVVLVFSVMPEQWFARMSTIKNYDQDTSAMSRINAWWMAFNLAKARPLGGGFDTWQESMFEMYAPDPGGQADAHSIYFEVLGEHGFVGLALFLLLGVITWRTASWVIRHARGDPEKRWLGDLAAMVQVSLVSYAVAGAFLGLAYFDFYYTLIAIVVLCKIVLQKMPAGEKTQRVVRGAHAPFGRPPMIAHRSPTP